jgi:mannosyltransferase OCH1-like enzyme
MIIAILFAVVMQKLSFKLGTLILTIALLIIYYNQIRLSLEIANTNNIFKNEINETIAEINRKEAPAIESIPKIIIQVWVQKDGGPLKIPEEETYFLHQMRKMNPDFQHMFFDGNDVAKFFETNYPEYYITYKRLPVFIQKLDFFRYLAIYHYGGFYFDMDINPHIPLDNAILNHSAVFPVDEYADAKSCNHIRMKSLCKNGQKFLLGQYAFGCTARHPFMKQLVDEIHGNLEKYINGYNRIKSNGPASMHLYVFKTTGPDFLTDCYVKSDNKQHIYILSNGRRQVFGDYATHNYIGTWK